MSNDASSRTRGPLIGVSEGREQAGGELLELVHGELRGMAGRFMREQGGFHTLQPTALVNEAWLRLAGAGFSAESRAQFMRVAATAMRSVLVDHARRRMALKRGEGRPAPLDPGVEGGSEDPSTDFLELRDVIERIAIQDPRAAQVVEMRLFAGMNHEEIASALGTSSRTVVRLWRFARAALQREFA